MHLATVNDNFTDGDKFVLDIIEIDGVPNDDLARKLEDMDAQAGQFLEKMSVLGDPRASQIYIIISVYHEYAFLLDIISEQSVPEISAIIFAENLEEAKMLLKTHSAYLMDLSICIDQERYTREELENIDVLDYIFGDIGVQFAQCLGNFGCVPVKWHNLIRTIVPK
jgi:hypothetical protein